MQYSVENLSSVKKKVTVNVSAEEVNASLTTTTAFFKKDLKMSGFRKGKVPSSVVESKFKNEIYQQAGQDLKNVHFNQIFEELNVQPLSELDVDADTVERDKDYQYTFSFEFLPDLELPEYRGVVATKNKVKISEERIDSAIERIQRENATHELLQEDRNTQNGEIALIDFAAYRNGELIEGTQANDLELPLGEGEALEEFESLVKSLTPGTTGERDIYLPQDFMNSELAGQTVNMSVTLKAIKQRVFPAIDRDLAQMVGNFDSVEEMRDKIRENLYNYLNEIEKSRTENAILEKLKSQVDIEAPESLLESQLNSLVQNKRQRLERQGKSLEAEGGEEKVREKLRPEAGQMVQNHIIQLSIANKEGLNISEQEVEQYIFRIAKKNDQDPGALRDYFEKNNMMSALKDGLLAEKAMEFVYNNAQIEEWNEDTKGL